MTPPQIQALLSVPLAFAAGYCWAIYGAEIVLLGLLFPVALILSIGDDGID